jgi:hypothetical protein
MKTLEFRDGDRDLPDHLAVLMKGMRTWELTFQEAKDRMHQNMTHQALVTAQRDLINSHFKTDGS